MPMAALAEVLKPYLGRPVVDMTGLKGNYQVALDFSKADMLAASTTAKAPDGAAGNPDSPVAATDPPGSSLLAALRRYGLRLEARKEPVEVLVVDHLEKTPTAN